MDIQNDSTRSQDSPNQADKGNVAQKPFIPPPNYRELKRWPPEHANADGNGKPTIW